MLFWNEVKKLWRQRTAKVFLALAAALLLFLCIMNITLGSSAFFYSGPENTALQKQYAQRWKGPLTGEKLAGALAFYQQGYADESKLVYDEQWGVWGPSNEQYAAYLIPTMDVLAPLESVLQRGTYERGTLRDARSEDALAFYDLRAQWLEEFLDGQFPQEMPGAAQDKAFFEAQKARVGKPFYYDYFSAGSVSGGLRTWAETLSSNIPYLQFFLVLGLGQIFAAEWRRKAAPVLLLHKAWPGRTGARKASGGPVLDICGQRVHAGGLSCLSVFGAGHKRPCLPCSADKAAGDSAAHHLADRAYLHGGHAALGGIFGQHRPVAVRLHSAFAAGVAMALGIFGLPLLAQFSVA